MWCGQLQAGYTCGWAVWLGGALNCRIPLKSTETNTIVVAKHKMLWHSFSINVRMRGAEKQIAHTCLTSVSEASQLQRLRGMLSRLMAPLYNSNRLTKSRACALLPEIHESHLNWLTSPLILFFTDLSFWTCFSEKSLELQFHDLLVGLFRPCGLSFSSVCPDLLLKHELLKVAEKKKVLLNAEKPYIEPFETFRGTSETPDCIRWIHKQA